MAAPWEKYQKAETTQETGPWSKFQKAKADPDRSFRGSYGAKPGY
jgi:hypothetical protein